MNQWCRHWYSCFVSQKPAKLWTSDADIGVRVLFLRNPRNCEPAMPTLVFVFCFSETRETVNQRCRHWCSCFVSQKPAKLWTSDADIGIRVLFLRNPRNYEPAMPTLVFVFCFSETRETVNQRCRHWCSCFVSQKPAKLWTSDADIGIRVLFLRNPRNCEPAMPTLVFVFCFSEIRETVNQWCRHWCSCFVKEKHAKLWISDADIGVRVLFLRNTRNCEPVMPTLVFVFSFLRNTGNCEPAMPTLVFVFCFSETRETVNQRCRHWYSCFVSQKPAKLWTSDADIGIRVLFLRNPRNCEPAMPTLVFVFCFSETCETMNQRCRHWCSCFVKEKHAKLWISDADIGVRVLLKRNTRNYESVMPTLVFVFCFSETRETVNQRCRHWCSCFVSQKHGKLWTSDADIGIRVLFLRNPRNYEPAMPTLVFVFCFSETRETVNQRCRHWCSCFVSQKPAKLWTSDADIGIRVLFLRNPRNCEPAMPTLVFVFCFSDTRETVNQRCRHWCSCFVSQKPAKLWTSDADIGIPVLFLRNPRNYEPAMPTLVFVFCFSETRETVNQRCRHWYSCFVSQKPAKLWTSDADIGVRVLFLRNTGNCESVMPILMFVFCFSETRETVNQRCRHWCSRFVSHKDGKLWISDADIGVRLLFLTKTGNWFTDWM